MMKNKMMRAASILLVAVLLSTCAISGTFAKYVTTASGTDTARVAKWGITMTNDSSDTFVAKYDSENSFTVHGQNVSTTTTDVDVVAPGTTSTVTYSVSGAPETAYQITFKAEDIQEVFLGAGTYTYTATGDASYVDMTQTVTTAYYPIRYEYIIETTNGTVKKGNTDFSATGTNQTNNKTQYQSANAFTTLTAALDELETIKISFDANEACDVDVKLTWTWAFENTDDSTADNHIVDAYDTILGDLIADNDDLTAKKSDGRTVAEEGMGKDYNLTVAYTLKMTATQVD